MKELVDGLIILVDDNPPAMSVLAQSFGISDLAGHDSPQDVSSTNAFVRSLRDEFSVPFYVQRFTSLYAATSKIEQRYRDSTKDGDDKLYLTVGVTDLVRPSYRTKVQGGEGDFGIINVALWVLKNQAYHLRRDLHFRSVYITNVYNFCTELIASRPDSPALRRRVEKKKELLDKLMVQVDGDEYLVHKEKDEPFGEGKITADVISEVQDKLRCLVRSRLAHLEIQASLDAGGDPSDGKNYGTD